MQMRLSVCLRGSAIFFFKEMDKVVGVFIADFQGDLVDLFLGGEQQGFCGLHPFFVEVFQGRQAEGSGKFVTDPVFIPMASPFQITELDMGCQVIVDIMLQLRQIGGAEAVLLFRRDRIYEKLRQNSGDMARVPQLIF